MPVRLNTTDREFVEMLQNRYAGFVSDSQIPAIDFEVELITRPFDDSDADVSVTHDSGRWNLRRGDFRAEWDPAIRHGWIRQSKTPYAFDAVLRIVHTLFLAKQGGLLFLLCPLVPRSLPGFR